MSFAARLGDSCAHGGAIVTGFPTVLIGGMPAARVSDMHVCPMATPAPAPIPHVGGPIIPPGSPTVLIGGMPAARMGDMAICVGPPDSIVMGCMTVMIGTAGSGSGSGGGAGSSGAASAVSAARKALTGNVEATTKEKHWIEFEFVDAAGNPVSGLHYKLKDTESKESESYLRSDGRVTRDALSEGESTIKIQSLYNAKWSKEIAKTGDTVELSVEADGIDDNEKVLFQIWKRDISGPDSLIDNIEDKIQGNKAKVEWKYDSVMESKGTSEKNSAVGYSVPEYYFSVLYGSGITTRSGFLYLEDFLEIELKDENGNPLKDEEYIIYTSNGEIRSGTLDANGFAKEEKLPGGICNVRFPNLPKFNE
ncbi:MAG: PAAR domain-containing protein [Ignavibacteriaceae bacterium]|jgi:uncharacterized Zn-binding protein involved in type VI secretion|nr:PAAR domain-containing protein [Ignavibacteriaceae bacterium]